MVYATALNDVTPSNTAKSTSVTVNVKRGATVSSTLAAGKLTFMCYNLGADPSVQMMSPTEQAAHTTPDDVYGDLYQWGRRADGHQVRTSPVVHGTLSGANLDPATGQVTGMNADRFVVSYTTPYDWRTPQTDTLWNRGTETAPVKTINDPCPAGWRMPTQIEWSSIFIGGWTFGAPGDAIVNEWTWHDGSGGTATGFFIAPTSGMQPLLFLPAAGNRGINGVVGNVDTFGTYSSSSINGENGFSLFFRTISVSAITPIVRAVGSSVRCIAEQ